LAWVVVVAVDVVVSVVVDEIAVVVLDVVDEVVEQAARTRENIMIKQVIK